MDNISGGLEQALGRRLKEARTGQGLTQQGVCRQMELDPHHGQGYLSRLETGRSPETGIGFHHDDTKPGDTIRNSRTNSGHAPFNAWRERWSGQGLDSELLARMQGQVLATAQGLLTEHPELFAGRTRESLRRNQRAVFHSSLDA